MHTGEGPRERFERMFRQHHLAVRRYARRRVPSEVVDDIVSETFLVAWRRLEQLPEEPLPWLLGVARNVSGTERRGAERRLKLWLKAQNSPVELADAPDAGVDDDQMVAALARLSERDREALTLVAWDGLRPAEAARVLGEPAGRFRVRLHRARRRLHAHLEVEPPTPEDSDGAQALDAAHEGAHA